MCRMQRHCYHASEKGSAADVAVGRPVDVLPKPERREKVDANGRSPGFSWIMTAMGGRANDAATENGRLVFLSVSA